MRISTLLLSSTVLIILPLGLAAAQASDASVQFISREQVEAAFARGMPLIEVGDYKIHASRREGPGLVEIHTRDTDIAYIVQGSATLITGGVPMDVKEIGPEELRSSGIRGGETHQLNAGDVVVIPNGTPHWFKEVEAPFLYYVVKVRQAGRETAKGAM